MPHLHEIQSPFSGETIPAAWTGCTFFAHNANERTIELEYETYETHGAAFGGYPNIKKMRRSIGPDRYDEFIAQYMAVFIALTNAVDEFIAPELTNPILIPPGPPVDPEPEPAPE